MSKESILIYTEVFLSKSETFIIDQILELKKYYNVLVLCKRIETNEFVLEDVQIIQLTQSRMFRYERALINRNIYVNILQKRNETIWEEAINSYKPKFLLIHYGNSALGISKVKAIKSLPTFVYFHGHDASKLINQNFTYRYYLRRYLERKNITSIFVSNALKTNYENKMGELPKNKYFISKLGINLSRFVRKDFYNKPFLFIQVGRLVEKKGHVYALRAFNKVIEKGFLDFKFLIVGSGIMIEEIKKVIIENQLSAYVEIKENSTRSEIIELYNSSTHYIQHSVKDKNGDTEGLPISIMEAMAMNLPIISTYHSGIPELVTNYENGLLCEEKDIDSFAENIIKASKLGYLNENRDKIISLHDIYKQCRELILEIEKRLIT